MKLKTKQILIISLLIISITSCVKKDFDPPVIPNPCDANTGLIPNVTIFDIQKLYNNGQLDTLKDKVYSFPADSNYVLEATVTSSDEEGNFYKEMYIQDETGAMKISIDASSIYNDFNQGQIIQIKLTDLNIEKGDFIYSLGMGLYDSSGLGRIPSPLVNNYIFRKSCPQDTNLNPKILQIGSFYDIEIGKLVKFENVEFIASDTGTTYANAEKQKALNKTIKDCNGNELIVRTSGYATFASDTIPSGKGSITGILSKYGQDYQLYIVKIKDVKMDSIRCN